MKVKCQKEKVGLRCRKSDMMEIADRVIFGSVSSVGCGI